MYLRPAFSISALCLFFSFSRPDRRSNSARRASCPSIGFHSASSMPFKMPNSTSRRPRRNASSPTPWSLVRISRAYVGLTVVIAFAYMIPVLEKLMRPSRSRSWWKWPDASAEAGVGEPGPSAERSLGGRSVYWIVRTVRVALEGGDPTRTSCGARSGKSAVCQSFTCAMSGRNWMRWAENERRPVEGAQRRCSSPSWV